MDKYLDIRSLPLLESRVSQLVSRLNRNKTVGSFSTQQQLSRAYTNLAQKFAKGHDQALYSLPHPVKGGTLGEEDINLILTGVYNELLYLFLAANGTEQLIEANFNFAVAWIRKLQAGIKYSKQQLAVYSLYATHYGNDLFFGETFSNEENVDRGSSFLADQECFIDLLEGTVSLPLQETEDAWDIDVIQVAATSNGVLGNNVEAGAPLRGSIASMHDGSTDTWTEYERVVSEEDPEGLQLELKISLKSVNPVNRIRIIPVFFGARTPFIISSINISENGRQWIDIKDDVRVVEFLDENPEERYHLSPHTARFSGEFSITFAPRFIKFIKISLRQSSTIPIIDVYGREKFRYAIGIKELSIHGHKYSISGELVSKPISFEREFSVVGIESLIDPPSLPDTVGGAEYFISADDGASWSQLTSLEEASVDIPEVVNVPVGTTSIRYKVRLHKNEAAFAKAISSTMKLPFREVHSFGDTRPFNLTLDKVPVSGTLSVCLPGIATRGKVYPRASLGKGAPSTLEVHTDGASYYRHGNLEHRIRLPFTSIVDPSSLSIYVNNTRWTQISSWSSSNAWSQHYMIGRDSSNEFWELIFGNNSHSSPKGGIPSSYDDISIFLSEEENYLQGLLAPYKMKLEYPSDGEKENTLIRFHGGYETIENIELPSGVTMFELPKKKIVVGTYEGNTYDVYISISGIVGGYGTFVDSTFTNGLAGDPAAPTYGAFQNFKTFIDGNVELSLDGDWTVDLEEGWIYTYSAIPATQTISVSFTYEKVIELDESEWEFSNGKLDEILVSESGYHAREASYSISSGVRISDVTVDGEDIKGIVPKSVRVSEGTLGTYSPFEVPFINGINEFMGRTRVQGEEIPEEVADADGIAYFRVAHYRNLLSTTGIELSDTTTFVTQKTSRGALSSVGDYYFDTSGVEHPGTGYLYVKLSGAGVSIPSGGTLSYQYIDPASRERYRGAYSVDSARGRIHFAEFTSSTGTVTFKYTPYRVRYNISQPLREGKDYEFQESSNRVRVLSRFSSEGANRLSVQYQYEPSPSRIAGLAPHFSPLLRGLALRVA